MNAVDYFMNGNSCSESVVMEAVEAGFCSENLIPLATSFSGGAGSGCMCGAISGALMVIGNLYGKNNQYNNPMIARQLTKEFMDKFKTIQKVTCCRILSKGTEPGTIERKQHCSSFVEFSSKILKEILDGVTVNG